MTDPHRSRRRALILAGAIYVLMIVLGCIPGEADKLGRLFPDYVLHATAYGGYALLITYGIGPDSPWRGLKVLVCIGAMGAVDEAIQSLLSYRTSDIDDWLVDMAAALVVTVTYSIVSRLAPVKTPGR